MRFTELAKKISRGCAGTLRLRNRDACREREGKWRRINDQKTFIIQEYILYYNEKLQLFVGGIKLYRGESSVAPVSAGATYDVKIESVGRDGDGIARIEGFVIFVPGTKIGDQVKIKISKVMQRFAIGEVSE